MKKVSFAGVLLGLIMGALVAMLSGSWIFWMAVGMALGILLGSAGSRRALRAGMRHGGSL